jgi:cation transport ATPase
MPPTSSTARVSAELAPRKIAGFQPSRSKMQFVSWTTLIALFAAVSIVGYLVVHYALHVPLTQARWVLIAVLAVGGAPLLIGLTRNLFAGEFGSDLLAGMSIMTSAVLGQYLVGSIVVLMLSGGTALEEYATRRASSVLGALAKRENAPHRAPETDRSALGRRCFRNSSRGATRGLSL